MLDLNQKLWAIEEIKSLKAKYFRYVDSKNWTALATIFSTDAEFDRTNSGAVQNPWTGTWTPPLSDIPIICTGPDEILAMIRNAIEHLQTVHHGFMPEIDIVDETNAKGIWAMHDILRTPDGNLFLEGTGHYHEQYKYEHGRWTISRARLIRNWIKRAAPVES